MFLSKAISCCRSVSISKSQLLQNVPCTWKIMTFSSCHESKTSFRKPFKGKKPSIIPPHKGGSLFKPKPDVVPRRPLRRQNFEGSVHDRLQGIPPYCEVDPNNTKLIKMLTAVKTRKQRYENMMIMLEGKRLIQEALVAEIEPLLILMNRKKLLEGLSFNPDHIRPDSTIIHHLHYRHIKVWSSLTNAPGIIGLFRMPNLEKNEVVDPLPVTLVCDNIREPGNLGSVLRVAAALPVEKVILLSGCVDLWDTKVTRGSCGAMFNLKILNNASWEDVEDECTGNVILADHDMKDKNENDVAVAETVRAEDYFEDPEAMFKGAEDDDDDNDNDHEATDLRKQYPIPLKSYTKIDYTKDQSYVIVIGGETHGLSEDSFRFASSRKGLRVHIPLAETVNSLNSATALGIISFEIKRQLNHGME